VQNKQYTSSHQRIVQIYQNIYTNYFWDIIITWQKQIKYFILNQKLFNNNQLQVEYKQYLPV